MEKAKTKIHPVKYSAYSGIISPLAKLFNRVKIVVALSGGVDSSVAAALLKKKGHDVIGVFMKFWKPRFCANKKTDLRGFGNRCCSSESEKRARLVSKKLGVPFYVFNFEKEFKKKVVDYFLKANKSGFTPNPCVVCNKEIKLGLLLEKALKLGADFVATGHYAQLSVATSDVAKLGNVGRCRKLLKGEDKDKDQSYFLWQLNQKQLSRVLFPVGGYTKPKVRKLAKKFRLPTAEAPESMEICFIQTKINDFLKKYLATRPGLITDKNGEIIGRHNGLWFYTIGQRKGLKITGVAGDRVSRGLAAGRPFYVLAKNLKKNQLIVSQQEKDLYKKELFLEKTNWISGKKPKLPLKVMVKIRYRSKGASAVITYNDNQKNGRTYEKKNSQNYKLIFSKPQRAITPGQSAVFYKGKELLGGGIII